MSTMKENLFDAVRFIGIENAVSSAVYGLRKAWAEASRDAAGRERRGLQRWYAFRRRVAQPERRWPLAWQTLGPVKALVPTVRGVDVLAARGSIEIALVAADWVRITYRRTEDEGCEPPPYAIAKPLEEWPVPDFVRVEGEQAFFLVTTALRIGVLLEDACVIIADAAGRLLRADVDTGWGAGGAVRHRTVLEPETRIFGLGERATPLDRRGRTHVLWNTDPAGYTTGDDPINFNIPVYLSLHPGEDSTSSSLIFYDNPHYAEFDLGETVTNVAEHRFQGGVLREYVAVGPVPALLTRYTALTGRHALPPLWMLGYQQSRWSYTPEARVRRLVADFQTHGVPCDAIHLDIDYMDGFRCFTWNEQDFDLPQLAADLREQGIKLITIIDPGIKQDSAYKVYCDGLEGRHFCTLPNGNVFHAPVWPGLSAFPDFTAPATRTWWGRQYRSLIAAGIAGFWNDMNEPAAFAANGDRTLPDNIRHQVEGRGGDHCAVHNIYGDQMARASWEGIRALQPDRRTVVITRAGWAGTQRHAYSWMGDNRSTWASLRLTVPMLVGLGLSGFGFSGPDVGGFLGVADGELFTRWLQLAVFVPFFRAHTAKGTADQEPWAYGEPYLSINRRFIQLRYELLPYLYTAAWQMATQGWPIVRPVWWQALAETALWEVDDAFLCGDALLVAPVGESGATEREVLLPPGNWYDYWTNRRREGGASFTQFASLETLPLFVREGTVLPLGEVGPTVEQRPDKFLRLDVYPLSDDGERVSWLYEDAGEGFGYRKGEQRVCRLVMRRAEGRLLIRWEKRGDFKPPYEHVALTLQGIRREPRALLADGESFPAVVSDPVRHTTLYGVPIFEELEVEL